MDPVSLSLAATVGSTVIGGVSSLMQGQAGAEAASYQAAIARNNAIIAKQNAQQEIQKGRQQSLLKDMETRSLKGKQIAGMAASGLEVGTGSFGDILESSDQLGRLDKSLILQGASKNATAYLQQASNFSSEANLFDMKSSSSSASGYLGLAGSLIGGASSFSDKWLGYKRVGLA